MVVDLAFALLFLSVVSAAIYGVWACKQQVSALRSMVKTLAVALLAAFVFLMGGPWLLVAALGLSALGDYFLSRDGDGMFLAGMVAFLGAHLAYIPLFLDLAGGPDLIVDRWPFALAAVLYMAIFLRLIWRGLGDLKIPVVIYSLAIGAMGLAALSLPVEAGTGYVLVGAFVFILSDSVLGLEKFRLSDASELRSVTPYIIWSFYWSAQALITYGTVLALI